jgi:Divergent InlB B-repeat domain
MKRIFLAAVFLLLMAGLAFGWGKDIPIWTGGTVNCFDVDYAMNGSMFVAFQAQGDDTIRIFSSSDHGATWSQIADFDTGLPSGVTPRNDLQRIRLLYDETPQELDVFFVNNDGYLMVRTVPLASGSPHDYVVSTTPIVEESFDITQNLNNGRIVARWTDGTGAGSSYYVRYSDDASVTWHDNISQTVSCDTNPRGSIAYGPPGNLINMFSFLPGCSTNIGIAGFRSPDNGSNWYLSILTDGSVNNYDPRTAAANVNNSGVWVIYDRDLGGHEIDLHFRYSSDAGALWGPEQTVSAVSGVDEYIADVKPYKGFPNSYINMVYIYDDPAGSPLRKAIWAWTSTGDPTTWNGNVTVNDEDITPWPEDVAPRIVYSPGAPATGGGVVFSYAGRNGLYFDSPWVHTLTVTVNGSGNVSSAPAGVDCTANTIGGTETCSAGFIANTALALDATPIDGTGYTSSFVGWSGDCTGSAACVLTMDSDKTVTAAFAALGIPVFALPVPSGQNSYAYDPVASPLENPDPSLCKPFAVGNVASGTLDLQVGLPPFSGNVDIYVALFSPDLDPGNIYLLTASGLQTLSMGMTPWRANSAGDVNESLFGTLQTSGLPKATYYLGVMVTPPGDPGDYYLWTTYFVIL